MVDLALFVALPVWYCLVAVNMVLRVWRVACGGFVFAWLVCVFIVVWWRYLVWVV